MRFKNNAVPVLTVLAWACGLVGLLAVPAVGTEVRVAYMYSDWPDGAARFRDEFDQAFATLGWQVTKFENRQAQELTEQLERAVAEPGPNLIEAVLPPTL